ncbi:hypothetical protein R6Z07F_010341 [Ovis aries]
MDWRPVGIAVPCTWRQGALPSTPGPSGVTSPGSFPKAWGRASHPFFLRALRILLAPGTHADRKPSHADALRAEAVIDLWRREHARTSPDAGGLGRGLRLAASDPWYQCGRSGVHSCCGEDPCRTHGRDADAVQLKIPGAHLAWNCKV